MITSDLDPRDIAIVGMGCRFSGADDLLQYWQLLRSGRRPLADEPPLRWSRDRFYHPDRRHSPNAAYTDRVLQVPDVDLFADRHFGLTPRRVEAMDPQHRLLLDVTRAALQDAGWEQGGYDRETTGVFVGISTSDYQDLATAPVRARQLADGTFGPVSAPVARALEDSASAVRPLQSFSMAGTLLNMAACTISQVFGLQGPSFAVDAACSSSLVALHQALLHLRSGGCRAAIVGGVSLSLHPDALVGFARMGAVSASGVCRPFDERADGFVLGEGAGVVVLRPLAEAVAAGDRIHAVIKGSGMSNDASPDSPVTPQIDGQVVALRRAYADAGVDPSTVGFVEAHGTGTTVGDATELAALTVLRQGCTTPLQLSSSKALIGHTLAAAGVAGLIKAALVLRHRRFTPLPGTQLRADTAATFTVAQSVGPWLAREVEPRRAGVSSFGFGGTNVHVVLEEAPDVAPRTTGAGRPTAVVFSAEDRQLLTAYLRDVADAVSRDGGVAVRDVARTLAARRMLAERVVVTASTRAELVRRCRDLADALASGAELDPAEGLEADPMADPGARIVSLPPSPLARRRFWLVQEQDCSVPSAA